MPATYMQTPIGPIPIRTEVAKQLHAMTDRDVADEAFKSQRGFINPEAFAELLDRDLARRGWFESDTYEEIERRETRSKAEGYT